MCGGWGEQRKVFSPLFLLLIQIVMYSVLVFESSNYFSFFLGHQKTGDKTYTISRKEAFRGACGQDCTTYFIPRDEKQPIYQLHNTTRLHHEPKNISLHEKGWVSHVICICCFRKSQVEIIISKHLVRPIHACELSLFSSELFHIWRISLLCYPFFRDIKY